MELLSCIHASPVIRVYGPLLCVLICALFYVKALSVSQSTIVNHTATHSAHSRLHIVTHRRTRPNISSHCPSRLPCRIPNTIGTSQVFHVRRLSSIFNYLTNARGAAPLVFPQRPRFRVFLRVHPCIHAISILLVFFHTYKRPTCPRSTELVSLTLRRHVYDPSAACCSNGS